MDINDYEILKKQSKEKRTMIEELAKNMNTRLGFNQGDPRLQVKEDGAGEYVLAVFPGVALDNLPDGWKVESNYMDTGKEVIWREKDGKREVIPVKHEENKSQVVQYDSPESVVDAILAVNSRINKSQLYVDRNANVIKMIGVVNDIAMPQGLEIKDGVIVNINDPYAKPYDIEKELASDLSAADMRMGTGDHNSSDVRKNIDQNPYQEEILSKYVKPDSAGATIEQFGVGLFDFNEMKRINKEYCKNQNGEISSQGKDGDYKSFSHANTNDPKIEATLELNKVWIKAYAEVSGRSGGDIENVSANAFDGDSTSVLFNQMINCVRQSSERSLSGILVFMCESDPELINHAGFIKVMGVFLSNTQVATALGIENVSNATPDSILKGIDKIVNQKLKDKANETFDVLEDTLDEGMQMIKQNNNNIY